MLYESAKRQFRKNDTPLLNYFNGGNGLWICLLLIIYLPTQKLNAQSNIETPIQLSVKSPVPETPEASETNQLSPSDFVHLFRYKPMYFAFGNPSTKIQLSFMSGLIEGLPLYFAYSQFIFWDLLADSRPFHDATYNPELFYRFNLDHQIFKNLDFGIWDHNSNGKAGSDSRSYNQVYLRANGVFAVKNLKITFSGKLKFIFDEDPGNEDIIDYLGPLDFEVTVIPQNTHVAKDSVFSFMIQPGGKFNQDFDKGGYQIGYSFRVPTWKFVPSFYFQYYSGFAEALVNYNERVHQFRAGILF